MTVTDELNKEKTLIILKFSFPVFQIDKEKY